MVLQLSPWFPCDSGSSIGQRGSESGVIVRDEQHDLGARITLESSAGAAPFAITCGIYGWMMHTRFFSSDVEANQEYDLMKSAIETILEMIPLEDDPEVEEKTQQVSAAIEKFVQEFP